MQPITFTPIYKERVWGGNSLSTFYGRELPDSPTPIGESWEMVDRSDSESIVNDGPWSGYTLNQLWNEHRETIFGDYQELPARFPLLIKILDCSEDLSLQVHPPTHMAEVLGGEPKTEMWYITHAKPDARLYVGLKQGVTREDFAHAIYEGRIADCIHSIPARTGDALFIPSGRLHAIGAGLMIFEIQQNSDTTYRVFDWNRLDLDGHPRQLHIAESLASIDFQDFEPSFHPSSCPHLAQCEWFKTDRIHTGQGDLVDMNPPDRFHVLMVVSGELESSEGRRFSSGATLLIPKLAAPLRALSDCCTLRVSIPRLPLA